jgi:hypothetical protein
MNYKMKNYLLIISCTLLAGMVMTGCKQDNEEPEEEQTTTEPQGANAQPTPEGVDASLWAVKSVSTTDSPIGPIELEMGIAVAAFLDDQLALITAGNVSCNTNALTQNANNSYSHTPDAVNITGIDFSTGVDWEVSGGNGIPAFNHSPDDIQFPDVDPISSSTTVDLTGYTLTTTSVTGADSVLFSIGGVMKTLEGNATMCTFSADELASLSSGASIAQIAAYTFTTQEFSGKDIWFGKEMVQTASVTLE